MQKSPSPIDRFFQIPRVLAKAGTLSIYDEVNPMSISIDWEHFGEQDFYDLKHILDSHYPIHPMDDDALFRLQKAYIRAGVYVASFEGSSAFLNASYSAVPHYPNVIEMSVGRVINSHPNASSHFDPLDSFTVPITRETFEYVSDYAAFQIEFMNRLHKYVSHLHHPGLMDKNAFQLLQKEADERKAYLQKIYPDYLVAEPENKVFYSTVENPLHPFLILPKGFEDYSMTSKNLSILDTRLKEETNGRGIGTITFPEDVNDPTLFVEFSYNGKPFQSEFFASNALQNATFYLEDCYDLLQNVMRRTQNLLAVDSSALPEKERGFVEVYQKLLQDGHALPVEAATYETSKLYTMAMEASKFSIFHENCSKKDVLDLLKKYSPGADLYPGSMFANIVSQRAAQEVQTEQRFVYPGIFPR